MTLRDYQTSRDLVAADASFHALLFACMGRAGGQNLARLCDAFPSEYAELRARYDAPGALLPGEPGYAAIQAERLALGLPISERAKRELELEQ